VAAEGFVQHVPVVRREEQGGTRQDVGLLALHVVQIARRVGLQLLLELAAPRLAHLLPGQQRMLQLADGALTLGVVGLQVVQQAAQLGRPRPQLRKEQFAFLPVMQALRELVDIEQHRAQGGEVGRPTTVILGAPLGVQQQR
jgi:hypothetical protein